MMYLLFFIAIVVNLFFNTKIPSSLGYSDITTISFLPILIYFVINMIFKKIRYDKDAIYVILLAVIIIYIKFAFGQNYFAKVTALLIIPMILSMCFDNLTMKELTLLRRITFIFYITLCGLSIVEWILNRNFFFFEETTWFIFRSTSLLGHPLGNGQVVAVFMAFIAVSHFKRKDVQIILFFLGYVSLFCFNCRGATLVVTFLLCPYFIWKINKNTQKSKRWIVKFSVLCLFSAMLYMVIQTPLGGRLMSMGVMNDGSTQARLNVFQFHKYYQSNDDFLWGNLNIKEYMAEKLGADDVENGVIAMIVYYGIIFTIPMLLLLFRFQYRKLFMYSKFERWLLLAVFFIIGCMNPNLRVPVQWTMWIYAYYVFRPEILFTETVNISNDNCK